MRLFTSCGNSKPRDFAEILRITLSLSRVYPQHQSIFRAEIRRFAVASAREPANLLDMLLLIPNLSSTIHHFSHFVMQSRLRKRISASEDPCTFTCASTYDFQMIGIRKVYFRSSYFITQPPLHLIDYFVALKAKVKTCLHWSDCSFETNALSCFNQTLCLLASISHLYISSYRRQNASVYQHISPIQLLFVDVNSDLSPSSSRDIPQELLTRPTLQ